MEYVEVTCRNIAIPVLKLEGNLYLTSQMLCVSLAMTPDQLRMVHKRYKKRLQPLSVTNCDTKLQTYLNENKDKFGIKRLRDDMLLWPLKEALSVAFHVHTNAAWEFHQVATQLMLEEMHARNISYAELLQKYGGLEEMHKTLEGMYGTLQKKYGVLEGRLDTLEELVADVKPTLQSVASSAGFLLNAQKDTLAMRKPN